MDAQIRAEELFNLLDTQGDGRITNCLFVKNMFCSTQQHKPSCQKPGSLGESSSRGSSSCSTQQQHAAAGQHAAAAG